MKKALISAAMLLTLTATATENACTTAEQSLAQYAYQVAKADGHSQPKLLVGIIKVESDAGKGKGFRVVKHVSGTTKSSFYGVGQLTIGAAKTVMQRFPDLWNDFNTQTDDELKARLILDDKFNIKVASKYLLLMGVNKNPDRGVTAYNVGPGGVQHVDPATHHYTLKVKRSVNLLFGYLR